ncbi:MAG TPA: CopG family transcriptional regulator [Solirubrobacterales bacterium]|nr:CopG family transcriptional regulator [Solirubrobacterales bacterium]
MKRTQIYLDDSQTSRLDEQASAEGVSRSTVIRRAVEEYLTHGEQDQATWRVLWSKALGDTAGIAPYLGDGESEVEELRDADADRLAGFDS